MDNNMFKTILNESIDFIDSELTIYNYSTDIKHLLYIIIPAFIIRYEYKNKNKIFQVFREVPLIETSENNKRFQAYYTSYPYKNNNKILTRKYILVRHYKDKPLIELLDNIIHEYNHAINSHINEIKITKKRIYVRTGLSYALFDKNSLKPLGIDDKNILEEILNTKQTEEVVDIINNFNKNELNNFDISNTLYSINNSIDNQYKSNAYSLQKTFTKNLTNNKTIINILSNMRFNGNIDEIPKFFDDIVGKENSYNDLIYILNESSRLEREYANSKFFKKIKLNKIKSLYKKANIIIDNFNNNYHFK
jgi:hypothetical protein